MMDPELPSCENEQICIKEESLNLFTLISPPTTPPFLTVSPASVPATTSRPRGSSFSQAGQNRARPYPTINRTIGTMSNGYGTWNPSGARHGHSKSSHGERRSSDEDQGSYAHSQFMNVSHRFLSVINITDIPYGQAPFMTGVQDRPSDMRSISSTSSLTGAMGDANLTSHTRHSRSPSSSNGGQVYTGTSHSQNHDLTWSPSAHMQSSMTIAMNNAAYPAVAGHGGLSLPYNVNQTNLDASAFNEYPSRYGSPSSLSPNSPQYQKESAAPFRSQLSHNAMGFSGTPTSMHSYSSSPEDKSNDDLVRRLQRRVQELEAECSRAKSALDAMRSTPAHNPTSAPRHSAAFMASWAARTEARVKHFCSLNRAGNALCSWHDSRRERRAYPPRNAPKETLNCGCSFKQALFEDSLSRHGVGSYNPGEAVRMDPALRNALLDLLEKRYGYKDGDFEHDPLTERWADGESPAAWEKKAQAGPVRRRNDADRH
jgi:hypothetical protein